MKINLLFIAFVIFYSFTAQTQTQFNTSQDPFQNLFRIDVHKDTIPFTEMPMSNVNLGHGTVALGDYDNDNDLDILITGIGGREDSSWNDPSPHISKIYRNDNGVFTDINSPLAGVNNNDGTIWCDFDNDGDLDLFIAGATREPNADPVSKIYRNDDGSFTDIGVDFPGIVGTAAWGDYDNDADLDIIMTGSPDNGSTFLTRIYRNDNGSFTDIRANLQGIWGASVAWGDYDNDEDLDLLLTGYGDFGVTTKLYETTIHSDTVVTFTDTYAPLQQVNSGSVAWGDYDNDGDLDIALVGDPPGGDNAFSTIYRNDNGSFIDIHPSIEPIGSGSVTLDDIKQLKDNTIQMQLLHLVGVGVSSVDWVDYDNDGDLDLALAGKTQNDSLITKIYRNDGNEQFTDIDAQLPGVWYSAMTWGDVDKDGDLDLLLAGFTKADGIWPWKPITRIYLNNCTTLNSQPGIPSSLQSVPLPNSKIQLIWNRSTDEQTPKEKLTYNIRIGRSPQGVDVISPSSNIVNGYRQVPREGNVDTDTTLLIRNLPQGTYYWSVQTIDNTYAGSSFATEKSFTIEPLEVRPNVNIIPNRFQLNQNHPNPFNPTTHFEYALPSAGYVTLKIFNILGQEVATLINEFQDAGFKSVTFDGSQLSSGIYFYRIWAGTFTDIKKMVLIK